MESMGLVGTDDACRRGRRAQLEERGHRYRRWAIALAAASATLVAPASALAADPPTLLNAGIDAQDQLYSTWSLAPGTTFDFVTYATVPDPDPTIPDFFATGNFAGFCSDKSLSATCTTNAHVAQFPSPRDRRYFVKVSANVTGTDDFLTSSIWVIDDAKPQIPGDAPLGAIEPTNTPVAGHPIGTAPPPPVAPPPPPPAAPAAAIKLLTLPKTIGALLTKGVRLQVACNVTCSPFGRLTLGTPTIGTKTINLAGGGIRVLTIKPSAAGRKRLRGRPRARIKVAVAVSPTGGATKRFSRTFTVRR